MSMTEAFIFPPENALTIVANLIEELQIFLKPIARKN